MTTTKVQAYRNILFDVEGAGAHVIRRADSGR